MTRLRVSLMSAALLAGIAGVGLAPAFAQSAAPQAAPAHAGMPRHAEQWMTPGQLVDGRIAFLQAELKITPAQHPQWQDFAAAMRQNAQSLDHVIAQARAHRGSTETAVDRLATRAEFARVRADNEARLLTAFKPLYASLSADQQRVANTLVAHARWHHEGHHRA